VIATGSVRENLTAIEESGAGRLRLIVGASGSGKSTLLAVLIRPKIVDTLDIAADYIKAAVFLDKTSTLESLAAELAAQLTATVPGFGQATQDVAAALTPADLKTLGSFDTAVRLPLVRCGGAGARIHIIVDGLDQPQPGARDVILTALQHVTHTAPAAELGHVRVIAGVRNEGVDTRDELAHARRIDITPPTLGEIAQAATTELGPHISEADLARMVGDATAGGWLIARMVREIADQVPEAPGVRRSCRTGHRPHRTRASR
jgi:hypothetical protein